MTDLFSWRAQNKPHLDRVRGKIGPAVLSFLRQRGIGGAFHATELHSFVGSSVAPASADRVLRDLRRNGACDYEIVNRRASFYRILKLPEHSEYDG